MRTTFASLLAVSFVACSPASRPRAVTNTAPPTTYRLVPLSLRGGEGLHSMSHSTTAVRGTLELRGTAASLALSLDTEVSFVTCGGEEFVGMQACAPPDTQPRTYHDALAFAGEVHVDGEALVIDLRQTREAHAATAGRDRGLATADGRSARGIVAADAPSEPRGAAGGAPTVAAAGAPIEPTAPSAPATALPPEPSTMTLRCTRSFLGLTCAITAQTVWRFPGDVPHALGFATPGPKTFAVTPVDIKDIGRVRGRVVLDAGVASVELAVDGEPPVVLPGTATFGDEGIALTAQTEPTRNLSAYCARQGDELACDVTGDRSILGKAGGIYAQMRLVPQR